MDGIGELTGARTTLNENGTGLDELIVEARDIIEASADGVVIVDSRGIIRFVNPEAERFFDYRDGSLVGRSPGFPLC